MNLIILLTSALDLGMRKGINQSARSGKSADQH